MLGPKVYWRRSEAAMVFHVMVRGIERGAVFRNDADRDHFLERIGELSRLNFDINGLIVIAAVVIRAGVFTVKKGTARLKQF
jgi:hypothetical protein